MWEVCQQQMHTQSINKSTSVNSSATTATSKWHWRRAWIIIWDVQPLKDPCSQGLMPCSHYTSPCPWHNTHPPPRWPPDTFFFTAFTKHTCMWFWWNMRRWYSPWLQCSCSLKSRSDTTTPWRINRLNNMRPEPTGAFQATYLSARHHAIFHFQQVFLSLGNLYRLRPPSTNFLCCWEIQTPHKYPFWLLK